MNPTLPSRTGLRSRKPPSLVRSTRLSSSAFCVRERSETSVPSLA
jgi:hypothetical protein